jgi:hypothetical protein
MDLPDNTHSQVCRGNVEDGQDVFHLWFSMHYVLA